MADAELQHSPMKASDERRPVRYEPAYATGMFCNMISHQSQVVSESISNVFHHCSFSQGVLVQYIEDIRKTIDGSCNCKCQICVLPNETKFSSNHFLHQSELILKFLQSFSHGINFLPARDFGIKQLALNPIYVAYSVCGEWK